MKVSFPHTDLLIEHLAQGTKVSSILFDHFAEVTALALKAFPPQADADVSPCDASL